MAETTPDPIKSANVDYNLQQIAARLEEVRVVLESLAGTFAALGPQVATARDAVQQVQAAVGQVAQQTGVSLEAPVPVPPAPDEPPLQGPSSGASRSGSPPRGRSD